MSAAAKYYQLCRSTGTFITPLAALSWSRQGSWGLTGFFASDAAVSLGVGVVSRCGKYVVRGLP